MVAPLAVPFWNNDVVSPADADAEPFCCGAVLCLVLGRVGDDGICDAPAVSNAIVVSVARAQTSSM